MVLQTAQHSNVWDSFARALETEPREHKVLTGVSGLEHPVQMLGVDEKRNRIIAVSSEPNARVAALMQVDVQAAMPNMKVLVARPIVFDLGVIVRSIFPDDNSAVFDTRKFASFGERLNKLPDKVKKRIIDRQVSSFLPQIIRAFESVTLPTITQIMDIIQQFNNLDWNKNLLAVKYDSQNASISLANLRHIDNLEIDRRNGVCPLPLYELSERDWGLLTGDKHLDDLRERLKNSWNISVFFSCPRSARAWPS